GTDALVIKHLTIAADDPFGVALADVNLTVHSGEIVGIAGVTGNGQGELLAAISGERPVATAEAIVIDGVSAGTLDGGARRARGFSFVPEERVAHGAVPEMSLTENALLTAHRQGLVRRGAGRWNAARDYAAAIIDAYGVKATDPTAAARSLSGGNLQKFIVGRAIPAPPRV